MNKSLPFLVGLLTATSILLTACQPAATATVISLPQQSPTFTVPPDTFHLVAIFPGVVTDADFNTLGYIGINEVQRDLDIDTAYVENVAVYNADAIIRGYIMDGYNIVWTHGAQYIETTVDIAQHFPNVSFIAEGDEPVADPPANLWFIDRNFQVGFYLIGATAALSTTTGNIGYIGGERLPFTYAEVHAIEQAIRDLGKQDSTTLKAVWVGDFNDPTRARKFTEELLAQNVDFIMGSLNLGMFGAFEAVKAVPNKKILITAKYMDKSGFAPDQYVTSLLYDFSAPLKYIVQRISMGETGGYYALGFSAGESLQLSFTNVDPGVEQTVKSLLDKIISGKIIVIEDTTPIQ
jgi:basic membrane protein A and related proteins